MDSQIPNIMISKNGSRCQQSFDPILTDTSSFPDVGLCGYEVQLDLLVENGMDQVQLLAHDICINGWDAFSYSGSQTLKLDVYGDGNTIVKSIGESTSRNFETTAGTFRVNSALYDCYNDWADDGYNTNAASILGGDSTHYSFIPGGSPQHPGMTGIADNQNPAPTGAYAYGSYRGTYHYTRTYDIDLRGSQPIEEDITLYGPSGGSSYLDETDYRTYNRYRLEIKLAGNSYYYSNFFRLGVKPMTTGKNVALLMKSRDEESTGPRTINLSNSAYRSNYGPRPPRPWVDTTIASSSDLNNFLTLEDMVYNYDSPAESSTWSTFFDISPPCDIYEGRWVSRWQTYDDKFDIYPNKSSSELTPLHFETEDSGVKAPIGLYDNDIGGEYDRGNNNRLGRHQIAVYSKPKFGGNGGWTLMGQYGFDGIQNDRDNVNTGEEAHSNQTERFWYEFNSDNVYRVVFSKLHYRNFLQFVLPFDQWNSLERCDEDPWTVNIDNRCNLEVVSLDWSNPNDPGQDYEYVHVEIGYEDGGGTWQPLKDVKVKNDIAGGRSDKRDLALIDFAAPDDPAATTWLSLINNDTLQSNQEYQVRLAGYYDNGIVKKFEDESPSIDMITADGHGAFMLKRGTRLGEYYFESGSDRIPEWGYCTWLEFEIDFNDKCDLNITKLRWIRPKLTDPKLRISLVGPGGSPWVHSEGRVIQPVLPPNEQELIKWSNELNDQEITFEVLLEDPPLPPRDPGDDSLLLNTNYSIQLTGYYPDDSSPVVGLTDTGTDSDGNDKDKTDGEIAAEMQITDNASPGIERVKFRHHDPQVTGGWSSEYQVPNEADGGCADNPSGLRVEITPDCDLKVTKLDWSRTDDPTIFPDNVHIEIGYLDSNANWQPMPGLGYRDVAGNWLTAGPGGAKGRQVYQHDPSDDSWDLMRWIDSDPNAITFKSLIDPPQQIFPDISRDWAVMLTGFYDGANLIKNPDQSNQARRPEIGDSLLADGDSEFQLVQHSTGPPVTYNLRSWDTVQWIYFPGGGAACPDAPVPSVDFEIEITDGIGITDDCHIQVTRLDWSGKRPATDDFHVSLGWDDNGTWREITGQRMAHIPVPPGTPLMFMLAVDRDNPLTETINTLRNSGHLIPNQQYELRITGYYDQPAPVQPTFFPTAGHEKADRRPRGKGIFEIVNFSPGGFKLWANPGDQFPPLANPDVGCLGVEPTPMFSVDIDQLCNIAITRLFWERNDGTNPPLEVSLMQGNNVVYNGTKGQIINGLGGAGTGLLPFLNWDPNPPRSPLYNGLTTTGVDYGLYLTGFYDNQTRQMMRWADPNIPGTYIIYTPNPATHANFRIYADTLPGGQLGYYLMAGLTRIPSNLTDYCNIIPPPERQTDCTPTNLALWTGPGTSTNLDKYHQSNYIWTGNGPPAAVPIPSERYDNYVSPYQNTTPKSPGQIEYWMHPAINYIPDPANNPGKLIPGTSHTRNTIKDNLEAAFEHEYNDQQQWRRDSVWELFGQSYKPETTIRWLSGPGTYGGSGFGSGWRNSYNYRVTPASLHLNLNAGGGRGPQAFPTYLSGGRPNGRGFNPRDITNAPSSQYLEFETDSPHEFMTGGNDQTDSLVSWEFVFYWDINITHSHRWEWYNEYDAEYAWDWGGNWGIYSATHTHSNPGCPTCTPPIPPSSYSHKDPITMGYHFQADSPGPGAIPGEWNGVGTLRTTRWQWTRIVIPEEITRRSRVTGELSSCPWVLIVRPPACTVRRRMWGSDAEVRPNPANPDPNDTDDNYEIFPAGKPDYTSRMELGNYNRFRLTPNTNTRATLRPNIGPWHPTNNNDVGITALPPVDPETYWPMGPKTYNNPYPTITDYHEEFKSLTPEWPGEYRLNWQVGWRSWARNQWPVVNPSQVLEYHPNGRIGMNNSTHTWKGDEPTSLNLTCSNPIDGIWVYVSAKPPECQVDFDIFEFTDPDTRIRIRLKNYNWVDLLLPDTPNPLHGHPGLHPHPHEWQEYEAKRPNGYTVAGNLDGQDLGTSPPTAAPLPEDIQGATYPDIRGGAPVELISDDQMATLPAPLGEYTYDWDLRVRRGIEWWSTADIGKLPNAWWDGDNIDERIRQKDSVNKLNTDECKEIIKIVRIPFFKTFISGASAGGRFGRSDEFDSCEDETKWIEQPTVAQGAWGHSADTYSLTQAVGSSVTHSLRSQEIVGGVYSSSLAEQPGSHTDPGNVQSKALTYANTDNIDGFGGLFSKPPGISYWRCIPHYWRIPEADYNSDPVNHNTGIIGNQAPNQNFLGQNVMGPGDGVSLSDGKVLHLDNDLEITGDIRDPGDDDLRVTIFVEGDVIISGDILNNDGASRYRGFSDMGLIQIIAQGNILVRPNVSRIDAVLVAYPTYDPNSLQVTGGGAIDLCAAIISGNLSQQRLAHYADCASNDEVSPAIDRQLRINGALVAQRIYLNRLHETLKNRHTPGQREPALANYGNTHASELVILAPEYQVATPAASVFEDWAKHPKAIFDIPTSL